MHLHTYETQNLMVGAGSVIFNEEGEPFRQSRNLRAILEHARRRGVYRIHIDKLNDGPRRPGALATVFYRGGDVGKIYFVCGSHAMDWAQDRSKASPRASWFAGCEVTSKEWAQGTWAPFNNQGVQPCAT